MPKPSGMSVIGTLCVSVERSCAYLKDAKSHVQLAGKLGSPFTLLCLLHHWEKELNMNQPFKLGLMTTVIPCSVTRFSLPLERR